jgi:hypothetical protein
VVASIVLSLLVHESGDLEAIIEMDSSILASALWSDSFDQSPEGVIYRDLLKSKIHDRSLNLSRRVT